MDGRIELGKHGLAQGAQMPDYTSRIDKAYDFQKDQIQKELDTQAKRQEKAEGLLGDLAKAKGYGKASRQLHEDAMGVRKRAAELMNNIKAGDISAMTELQDLVGNWKADAAQAEAVKTAIIKIEDQARKNGAKTTQRTWDNIARAKEGTLEDYYNPEFLNFGAETVPDLDANLERFKNILKDRVSGSIKSKIINGEKVTIEETSSLDQAINDVLAAAAAEWDSYETAGQVGDIYRNYGINSKDQYLNLVKNQAINKYKSTIAPDTFTQKIKFEEEKQKIKDKGKGYDSQMYGINAEGVTDHFEYEKISDAYGDDDMKEFTKSFTDYGTIQPSRTTGKGVVYNLNLGNAKKYYSKSQIKSNELKEEDGTRLGDDISEEIRFRKRDKGLLTGAQFQYIKLGYLDPNSKERVSDEDSDKAKLAPIAYFKDPKTGETFYTPLTLDMVKVFSSQDKGQRSLYKGVYRDYGLKAKEEKVKEVKSQKPEEKEEEPKSDTTVIGKSGRSWTKKQ